MTDHVTFETFEPHQGKTFEAVLPEGGTFPLVLAEVTLTRTDDDPRRTRAPFSLIFRPVTDGITLRQGMYVLDGAAGRLDVFLVPIMPDGEGARIQAIFA